MSALLDRWRLAALAASAAMLAIAHGFDTFGGYAPCELCLRERTVYWIAGGFALAAMGFVRLSGGARFRGTTAAVLALVFLVGAGLAAYHAGAEWRFWPGPRACASATGEVTTAALQALMEGGRARPPACDRPALVIAGLSMAGWNALISVALAALSAAAAWRERTRS